MNYKFVLVDTTTGSDVREWVCTLPITVGRGPTAEITIGDDSISRRHCEFHVDPHGSLVVRDLGSKNGVFVEQRRVEKAIVRPGTEVRIGMVTMRAELTDEDADLDDGLEDDGQVYDLGETQPMKIVRPNTPPE